MPRTVLSISILLLLFAGIFATISANHDMVSPAPRRIEQAGLESIDQLGIDCGLGSIQAVVNGTGFPVAPSENNPSAAETLSSCTWAGDAGQTVTSSNDGTNEPLVIDQDESLSAVSPTIGGGFTAVVEFLQNSTTPPLNGFDIQVHWNPKILHAAQIDSSGLPWSNPAFNPFQVANSIDNVKGVARLGIVVTSALPGNQTLFRLRFDVVGVGVTNLNITPGSGTGIANPGSVVYQTTNGALDSETLYDPAHTINWSASFTNSTPIVPGSPSTFDAIVSGGTAPYIYSWQFDSCNQIQGTACIFKSETTGNPATITMPTTVPGFRVDLEVNDSGSHEIHLVRAIPFVTGTLRDSTSPSNTFSSNTVQTFQAVWLGGVPPYNENARFCPGIGTTPSIICTLPNPTIVDSAPTQIMSENVTYKLSGVYTNTLSITDSRGSFAGGSNIATLSSAVNVTRGPQAYNISISKSPTSPAPGSSVSITAKIVYAAGYPTSFESAAFLYTIAFGDGVTLRSTIGPATFTTSHSYASSGNYTIRVTARENSARAVSQIEEAGTASVLVHPSSGFDYLLSANPGQASISSGASTSTLVSVTSTSSTAELVGLRATFSIPGVIVAFNSSSGIPSYSSTMTITSQPSTPNGSYIITIVGNSTTGVVHQTTFMLIVGPEQSGPPVLSVFSTDYGSATINDTSLAAGSTFYVQVNVRNAPSSGWNGYEFALFYDQRYINVTSYDVTTNTVFPTPFLGPGTFNSPGALRLQVVDLGVVTSTMGMLVNITFRVATSGGVSPLTLAPGTAQPGSAAGAPPGICQTCPTGAPNWSRLISGNTALDVSTINGYFNNAGGNPGPVASFTYSPANPLQGQTITFNATSSYDPDNSGALNHGILEYMWDFGTISSNGNETTFSPVITHVFSFGTLRSSLIGNFTVRLTVIDSDNGFEGIATHLLTISPNLSDEHPIASFSYAPSNPVALSTVTFNGTASFDPDGTITTYYWNFGDGGSSSPYPFPQHFYDLPGNYTVTLTVTDSDSQTASESMIIHVMPRPPHDVSLTTLYASPTVVVSGQTVNFILEIGNTGTLDSTVNATVYYNGKIATSRINIVVPGGTTFSYYYDLSWATTGVAAGNYTISATVFLAGDPTPSDNSLTDGQLTVFPPPVLTATPGDGPVGTTVTLHGSGFLKQYYGFTNEFEITFDNQFIGYSFASTSFNFTFDVPPAQAGSHFIHAVELYPSLDVQASFTVTLTPSSVSVAVTTGAIYFPGDTVTIFVQTSLNGTPTTVTSIQAILVKPGNTNTTLTLALLTIGIYKATYNIPTTGPIGTYTIIIKTHQTGANDGQSLTTFEVNLSWLSSHAKSITAGVAITGLVGVAAVAWRKGYFRRKNSEDEADGSISDAFTSP